MTIQGIGQATVINRDGINPVFTAGAQSNWVFRDFKTDAGGIELTAATAYTLQNITIGASYIAFRTDVAAEAWDIPIGRTATIVVAAHNSSPQSKAQADFIADGVDDQVTIQAAIDALPAGGGKVVLLEGTYHITFDPAKVMWGTLSAIALRSNLTLVGQGSGTLLRIPTITTVPWRNVIGGLDVSNVRIEGLRIDLNHGGDPATGMMVNGITILGTLSRDIIIHNNIIFNGAYGENIRIGGASRITISNNILLDSGDAVGVDHGEMVSIMGNIMRGATTEAVDLKESSYSTIIGNLIENSYAGIGLASTVTGGARHNQISGNVIRNSGFAGMHFLNATHNIVSSNIIEESANKGIVFGASSSFNIVKGNNLKNLRDDGIWLDVGSQNNLISGNHITNASTGVHGAAHALLVFGIANTIEGNVLRTDAPPAGHLPHSGILLAAGSHGNIVKSNDLRLSVVSLPLTDWGANNKTHEAHSELFMDVLAASPTHVRPAITPDGLAHTDVTSPDVPRNAMLRITNTDGVNAQTPSGGNIVVEGVDARGNTISETLTVPATSIPAGGTLDIFGSRAFATVSKVTYYSETNPNITVSVGIANRIGLPVHSSNFERVYRVVRNGATEAVGAVDPVNGTVNLGMITTGDDFLIHYKVNLSIIR
ncbi:right-handed parallel beta-helix repeat-containing protein [Dehalococcoidia bacterium]|nr:right-handed parallel beta-helix repeat-containing protein [Dehalococcoidia bacterium]